jgi:hypothetical protein
VEDFQAQFRTFTLDDANFALSEVVRLCDEAIERVQRVQFPWHDLGFVKYHALHQISEEELIKLEWAQQIAEMGIMPKGWLIVDFQSPDPDTVYCWQYGEGEVCHEHKTWERFLHRRPIRHERSREEGWRGEER